MIRDTDSAAERMELLADAVLVDLAFRHPSTAAHLLKGWLPPSSLSEYGRRVAAVLRKVPSEQQELFAIHVVVSTDDIVTAAWLRDVRQRCDRANFTACGGGDVSEMIGGVGARRQLYISVVDAGGGTTHAEVGEYERSVPVVLKDSVGN